MTDAPTYRFDGWTLHPDSGELVRDGKSQRLTQQPLRILLELLGNPGRVITRERLVEVLWPKGVVDYDNGLNVAVRKLRLALGDESETPRYIETLPRIGYRFVGRIDAPEPAPRMTATSTMPATSRWNRSQWTLAGGIVGGLALAVIWLNQAIRSPLADSDNPAVTSPAIAPASTTAPIVARRTTSVRAYEHYLQGIFHRSRRDVDGTPQAITELKAAIAEDPEYAEAWAGLSDTYIGAAIGHSIPASQAFEQSLAAARRSVELDPGLAETHTALGQIHMFYQRDYAAAEAAFAQARAANERYARLWHHLAMLRGFQGRPDEALAAVRRARELEPMTLLYSANHALVLYHARRFDEAIDLVRGLLVAQPGLNQSRSLLIRALVAQGKVAEALAELPRLAAHNPNRSDAALVYAHAGQPDKARAEIESIENMSAAGFGVGYELAVVHAALGDMQAGCRALDLAWRDSSPFLGWMRLDPRMDPLREQPCFAQILARFKTE